MVWTEGRLGFNSENGRYGLLVMDLWEIDGFCCGEALQVQVEGKWIPSRMEMTADGEWYLTGTPFVGNDLEFKRVRAKK